MDAESVRVALRQLEERSKELADEALYFWTCHARQPGYEQPAAFFGLIRNWIEWGGLEPAMARRAALASERSPNPPCTVALLAELFRAEIRVGGRAEALGPS